MDQGSLDNFYINVDSSKHCYHSSVTLPNRDYKNYTQAVKEIMVQAYGEFNSSPSADYIFELESSKQYTSGNVWLKYGVSHDFSDNAPKDKQTLIIRPCR